MIAIIDYKAGNAPSVLHAARRLGLDASLASSGQEVQKASHIILPGVGNAKATMKSLNEAGLVDAMKEAVFGKGVYFLGICIGLQVLFEHSREEDTDCFGWLKGQVVRFDSGRLRVPQMGWNKVDFIKSTPVRAKSGHYYFVNSYYAVPADASDIWGETDYGGTFTSAVNRDNIYGAQFHVEKSGEDGLRLLNEFCSL